jgi:uncharacterized Tic20 family protein
MSEGTPKPPYGPAEPSGQPGAGQHGPPAAAGPAPGQPGQAYPGQPYPGQPHPGQQYPGQAYPGQPGQQYPGGHYPGQPPYQRQNDDTTWALMNYVGVLIVGFLAPLIIYFVKRNESQFVRFHAAQCLNVIITIFVYTLLLAGVLVGVLAPSIAAGWTPGVIIGGAVGIIGLFSLITLQLVYMILGIVRSSRHEFYQLPKWICWRMIK